MTKIAFMLSLVVKDHRHLGSFKRRETEIELPENCNLNGHLTDEGRELLDVDGDGIWLHTLPFSDWLLSP